MSWIDGTFPGAIGRHVETSPCNGEYNCIAWAAGEDHRWWTNTVGYYWPVRRSPLVSSLIAAFESIGYTHCTDETLEFGFEKVAIYAYKGAWKHASRQLASGKWTSKLGPDEDIEHDTAECLCGELYGEIHCYMRRPKE